MVVWACWDNCNLENIWIRVVFLTAIIDERERKKWRIGQRVKFVRIFYEEREIYGAKSNISNEEARKAKLTELESRSHYYVYNKFTFEILAYFNGGVSWQSETIFFEH